MIIFESLLTTFEAKVSLSKSLVLTVSYLCCPVLVYLSSLRHWSTHTHKHNHTHTQTHTRIHLMSIVIWIIVHGFYPKVFTRIKVMQGKYSGHVSLLQIVKSIYNVYQGLWLFGFGTRQFLLQTHSCLKKYYVLQKCSKVTLKSCFVLSESLITLCGFLEETRQMTNVHPVG